MSGCPNENPRNSSQNLTSEFLKDSPTFANPRKLRGLVLVDWVMLGFAWSGRRDSKPGVFRDFPKEFGPGSEDVSESACRLLKAPSPHPVARRPRRGRQQQAERAGEVASAATAAKPAASAAAAGQASPSFPETPEWVTISYLIPSGSLKKSA